MRVDRTIEGTITNIYRVNLGVKGAEKILIFTDDRDERVVEIAGLFRKVGERLHGPEVRYIKFPSTGTHGAEPPEPLWVEAFGRETVDYLKSKGLFRPLLEKRADGRILNRLRTIIKKFRKEAVDVVIALSYFSTTHTIFRDLLTGVCGTRYASMPLFDISMLEGPMRVDWKEMAERTRRIAKRINRYEAIEFSTPAGTFLRFSKKGRRAMADTGILTKRGSVSNLPAGEVYLAPVEGTAEGRLILEWAPTRRLRGQVVLDVEGGKVKSIWGDDEYVGVLEGKISERPENANIAEFGIGTNDMASRPDNILESEKILGTVHVALGDNFSFGGKVRTPFHQDFIFFKPTVILISGQRRVTLIKDGRV